MWGMRQCGDVLALPAGAGGAADDKRCRCALGSAVQPEPEEVCLVGLVDSAAGLGNPTSCLAAELRGCQRKVGRLRS